MRILKSLAVVSCAAMAAVLFLTASPAQAQAQEPHYLRALSDLRTARDYVQFDHRPGYQGKRDDVVRAIDKAIEEIKRASWDDGKQTRFAPPAGVTDPWFPLHQAQEALHAAHHNVEQGVDRPENQGLRAHALENIEAGEAIISRILLDEHR